MERIEIKSAPTTSDNPVSTEVKSNEPQIMSGSVPAIPQVAQPDAVRPAWLPEKFKSAEDFAKSYQELESRFTKESQQPDPLEKAVATGQLSLQDVAPMSKEFADTGEISEASYKLLAKKGVPRELVDAYVEGQKSLADNQVSTIYSSVGGQDQYKAMTTWASENLAQDEVAAFDQLIESGNQASILMAVRGLHARYTAADGTPRLLQGNASNAGTSAFRSLAELTAAMKDPKYKSDPAYRKDVEEKLRVSNIFGGVK